MVRASPRQRCGLVPFLPTRFPICAAFPFKMVFLFLLSCPHEVPLVLSHALDCVLFTMVVIKGDLESYGVKEFGVALWGTRISQNRDTTLEKLKRD